MIKKIFWGGITLFYLVAASFAAVSAFLAGSLPLAVLSFMLYMGYSACYDKVTD